MAKSKRVAVYTRVSTDGQSVENQRRELMAVAERHGWEVVQEYTDHGISGAKDRDKRPAFDRMLKGATRREFDMIAAWSVDRLGRSLQHLIAFLGEVHGAGVDLYLHQQSVDTTTPSGKAMFQMLGVFAEFERSMIVSRVNAGLKRARANGVTLGRPRIGADDDKAGAKKVAGIKAALAESDAARARGEKGRGLLKIAADFGVGSSTVQRVKHEMTAERAQL